WCQIRIGKSISNGKIRLITNEHGVRSRIVEEEFDYGTTRGIRMIGYLPKGGDDLSAKNIDASLETSVEVGNIFACTKLHFVNKDLGTDGLYVLSLPRGQKAFQENIDINVLKNQGSEMVTEPFPTLKLVCDPDHRHAIETDIGWVESADVSSGIGAYGGYGDNTHKVLASGWYYNKWPIKGKRGKYYLWANEAEHVWDGDKARIVIFKELSSEQGARVGMNVHYGVGCSMDEALEFYGRPLCTLYDPAINDSHFFEQEYESFWREQDPRLRCRRHSQVYTNPREFIYESTYLTYLDEKGLEILEERGFKNVMDYYKRYQYDEEGYFGHHILANIEMFSELEMVGEHKYDELIRSTLARWLKRRITYGVPSNWYYRREKGSELINIDLSIAWHLLAGNNYLERPDKDQIAFAHEILDRNLSAIENCLIMPAFGHLDWSLKMDGRRFANRENVYAIATMMWLFLMRDMVDNETRNRIDRVLKQVVSYSLRQYKDCYHDPYYATHPYRGSRPLKGATQVGISMLFPQHVFGIPLCHMGRIIFREDYALAKRKATKTRRGLIMPRFEDDWRDDGICVYLPSSQRDSYMTKKVTFSGEAGHVCMFTDKSLFFGKGYHNCSRLKKHGFTVILKPHDLKEALSASRIEKADYDATVGMITLVLNGTGIVDLNVKGVKKSDEVKILVDGWNHKFSVHEGNLISTIPLGKQHIVRIKISRNSMQQ
ncbi:MAG: hypothetical protein QXD41_03555, partial [Nitrososphaeria archaeon]